MRELASRDLDSLLDRQKQAWAAGQRPSVEELLAGLGLQHDADAFLDLLYNEVVLREEQGEHPAAEEYALRYPHLQDELRLHFEVHAALHEQLLGDTRRLQDAESVVELQVGAEEAGPTLPDYEIVGQLGLGGMGVVYKARHRRLRRLVALKMFQPGRIPSPRELVRFHTEAEAIARLQHPNIVQIFEVGQCEGLPYLALELAAGGTLARRLQDLPLAPRAAAELVETLARAIEHAHAQQIVHRDLKPANVLFAADGTPKITDFGLAKMLEEGADGERDATRTGEPIGTPRYMAPEQAAGCPDRIGPATDVYALGTILYECLTGRAPFVAPSAVATMLLIRDEQPQSPRRQQRSVPRDLETICLKCLHKEPGRRYASAAALADDLRRFLRREPIHARPTPAWERFVMWCRRRPAIAALTVVGVLALLAAPVAVGVSQYLQHQRLAGVRAEVAGLVRDGQEALAQHDAQTAEVRFLSALTKVRAEPALAEQELNIAGWLDHSRRRGDQQRYQQRRPPPRFEELRDEALVQCVLLEPRQPRAVQAARNAIAVALELTVAEDPAWRVEREQLALLDADLLLREGKAEAALTALDGARGIECRLWHQHRAECLDRLGRKDEAAEARRHAERMAPQDALGFYLSGISRLHEGDLAAAIHDFDELLTRAPEHFMGRLFQAACFLRGKRPAEAKVALIACLARQERCPWTCLLLGEAYEQLNEPAAALQALQRGLHMQPRDAARFALLAKCGFVHLRLEDWGQARAAFDQALALQPDAAQVQAARKLALARLP
jgi:tetratricopeptide (TPR) repeat protein/tRNA A-37 threonylcarbamoyl transferase component Bud32